MRKIYTVLVLATLVATSCVQKTKDRVVVVKLILPKTVSQAKVGIRGGGNPLRWETDLPLKPVLADSVFTASFVCKTAYDSYEVKFTLNDEMELNNLPNRILVFNNRSDTTYFTAVFNKP